MVNDKHITICGGTGTDVVPQKCYFLDPDHGGWVQTGMETERQHASSSLFGEGDDMLISGGRNQWTDTTVCHKDLEIVGEGKPPSVSVSVLSEDSFSEKFNVSNLLTWSEVENHTLGNYWLGPLGQKGEFILDLGETRLLDTVELVNTHNAEHRDWAMKEFQVLLGNRKFGHWNKVVEETLEDTEHQTDPLPVQKFKFSEKEAKLVKFKTKSSYRTGGGLQYFSVSHSG